MTTVDAVDCQSFAGGFTLGHVRAGLRLVGKREDVGGFGVDALEANRHLLGYDWEAQATAPAEWDAIDAPYVFSNPPCSAFSVLTQNRYRGSDSKINNCMWNLITYAAQCNPEFVVMESVPQAFSQGRQLLQELRLDLEARTGKRYHLTHVLEDNWSVGGCSARKRYLMVLHSVPFGVEAYDTVAAGGLHTFGDAIDGLENQPLSWSAQPYVAQGTSRYAVARLSANGLIDGHDVVESALGSRVSGFASRVDWPEGTRLSHMLKLVWEETGDIPQEWAGMKTAEALRERHRRGIFNGNFDSTEPRRWYRDYAARTANGGVFQQIVHPTLPRMVTHREVLRVMGFPDDWNVATLSPKKSAPYWGKGVSVPVGEWIGTWVKSSILGAPGSVVGELIGERESLIDVSRDWRQLANHRGLPFAVPSINEVAVL